jgi:hypothetical protein
MRPLWSSAGPGNKMRQRGYIRRVKHTKLSVFKKGTFTYTNSLATVPQKFKPRHSRES